jgi:uncharacterized protein
MNDQLEELREHIKSHLSSAPKCHDWDHTLRVLKNAQTIANSEGGDWQVIELAVLLHDIARPDELEARGKVCHAQLGAQMVYKILPKFGYNDELLVEHVAHCVLTHRSRNGHSPETMESKIVFDADKLDSIGAIGIGRAFHFAGRFGARIHNNQQVAIESAAYSVEDTAYREYLVKLRTISQKMYTETGRNLAQTRHQFMVQFFEQLNQETDFI